MKMEKEVYFRHTDLAMELQEELEKEGGAISRFNGITIKKRTFPDSRLREVIITVENEEGEKLLGKPRGTYITLEGEDLSKNDGDFHENMSRCFASHLKTLLGSREKILFVGLGNMEVTPDSLGPLVVQNLLITRHLNEMEYFRKMRSSMAIAPGVMAQTGMETGEILKGIVQKVHPEAMVVIDALAAKTSERLNRTIQISNAGIAPGSGVGNHRNEISAATMGIPVIAVGVPTVISIPAIAGDIIESVLISMGDVRLRERYEAWSDREKYRFMAETLREELFGLFVTPKEIDESVKRISYTISEGINQVIARKNAG
ncbi:MAG: GPR endopeptidase [Anaerobutyricum sp.]|nr:GPR endopeptidase [Anaerobutyricum sp.]